MKIAEVIPLIRLPRSQAVFDYLVTEKLAPSVRAGQVVAVPFRNREVRGLVIQTKEGTSVPRVKLKAIREILSPTPLLTKSQQQLAKYVARTYRTSLATVIKSFLPPIPKRIQELAVPLKTRSPARQKPSPLPDSIVHLAAETGATVVWYQRNQDREEILHSLGKYIVRAQKRALFLTPRIESFGALRQLLSSRRRGVVEWSSEQRGAPRRAFALYQQVLTSEAPIILGTRSALFLPFSRLDLIVVDEEEDSSHKQEEPNPRYDARVVVQELARLARAKLVYLSAAPRVETVGRLPRLRFPAGEEKRGLATIVDMRGERGYLSHALSQALEQSLAQKGKSFLFLNRRGQAIAVRCEDCGYLALCPNCKLPLVLHHIPHSSEDAQVLLCHHCGYATAVPPFCPNCNGPHIRYGGKGTGGLEREIRREFESARVIRVDRDTRENRTRLKAGSWDITIGTSLAFPALPWGDLELVGVISADTNLYIPDFRSSERTFQLLATLHAHTASAHLIVQTYHPEHPAIRYALSKTPEKFYEEELSVRKELLYPPASRLIKLIGQDRREQRAKETAGTLEGKLKRLASKTPIRVIGPLIPFQPKVRGRYRFHIILKVPQGTDQTQLDRVLGAVPDDWIIDVDPEDLL